MYNIRGSIEETYPVHILKGETKGSLQLFNKTYYTMKLARDYSSLQIKTDQYILDKVYFSVEQELLDFLENIKKLRKQYIDLEVFHNENDILDSIKELGTVGTENLDEDVTVGNVTSVITADPIKGLRHSELFARSSTRLRGSGSGLKALTPKARSKALGDSSCVDSDFSPRRDGSCPTRASQFKGKSESTFTKFGDLKQESGISKAVMDKKQLSLNAQEFGVKIKGVFGITHKRLLRFTEDFEYHFYRKEKEKYIFTLSLPIYKLAKVIPKRNNSNKVYFYLKNDVSFYFLSFLNT